MAERVCDLEQFVLKHIYRPYWGTLTGYTNLKLDYLTQDYNLSSAVAYLNCSQQEEWSGLVLKRIKDIGFTFPEWIQHPLVDYLVEEGVVTRI